MLEYSDIWKIITKILESSDKKYLIRHHIESYDYFLVIIILLKLKKIIIIMN